MPTTFWLLLVAIAAAAGWLVWHNLRKWQARQLAEEERFANFMTGTSGKAKPEAPAPLPALAPVPTAPPAADGLPQQKLLFEAARKAGEAGEPALAIQLYARLLSRYPATSFAEPARAAAAALKKRLVKA